MTEPTKSNLEPKFGMAALLLLIGGCLLVSVASFCVESNPVCLRDLTNALGLIHNLKQTLVVNEHN